MIRTWVVENQQFAEWCVNLEQPWARTTVGFDSRDDVLDVSVSANLGEWQLKDADELEFAVDVGLFTPTEARSVHNRPSQLSMTWSTGGGHSTTPAGTGRCHPPYSCQPCCRKGGRPREARARRHTPGHG